MSQSLRQSELFSGNDWTAIYRAFTQVNLNAFDFQTIRSAMTTYINLNYPEQYNDWANSAEFVAILDLVAYLGQSLAFRMDLNARENFIDIARRRESILQLARYLSYNARRNIPASGLLKMVGLSTTQKLTDSSGNSLNNKKITWNDPSNYNWFEQWTTILNAALVSTNPFGTFLDQQTIDSIPTQLYRLNSSAANAGQFPFTSLVDNSTMNFEVVNMNIDSTLGFVEAEPNLQSKFQFCYKNDGNGYASPDCGFFSLFKQGQMQHIDYNIPNPIANNTLTIAVNNINDSDVWVQTVNDNGYISSNGSWTKVGYVPTDDITKIVVSSDNITYNSISATIQNIYEVVTLANDQIMIRFGDGNFGAIPTGNIRTWFRVSSNDSYYIRADEIQNIPISIPYIDSTGNGQTLTITYSLQETILNSAPSQTDDDVRRIAGGIYSTQGRMVSASDYNTLPQTVGNGLKIKATNRIYSGQSKYIDLNDPTGQYQNTNLFCDDGAIYSEYSEDYAEISTSSGLTSSEITYDYLITKLSENSLKNFILNDWLTNTSYNFSYPTVKLYWQRATGRNYTSTGAFVDSTGNIVPVGSTISTNTPEKNISVGALLKFQNSSGATYWAAVDAINANGTTEYTNNGEGPIRLNLDASTGDKLLMVLPNFITTFSANDITNITNNFTKNQSFGIGFDAINQEFYYIPSINLDSENVYNYQTKGGMNDTSWLIRCDYSPLNWRIYTRNLDYVVESESEAKFFFINNTSVVNPVTSIAGTDSINILKYNFPKSYNGVLTKDISFNISGNYTYPDGYIEPRRVKTTFATSSVDGQPLYPDSFANILDMSGSSSQNLVFHVKSTDQNGYDILKITHDVVVAPNTGDVVYTPGPNVTDGTFATSITGDDPSNYMVNVGITNVSFMWKHLATIDHRIDPSITNIIDMFVLTNDYNTEMNTWRTNGYDNNSLPSYPSEVQLQMTFSEMENYKMFSDEIIWRPVKFKLIGGETADETLRFTIKAVTLPGTSLSNGEIQANILNAVNTYFNVSSWDFGETFYASELIGYLHQQLLNSISSVVIVPTGADQTFGNLFQISCNSDELFFPTLTVNDVEIIPALTTSSLRIR